MTNATDSRFHFSSNKSGSCFQRYHTFGCSSRTRLVSVGHLSLHGLLKDTDWGDVSAQHLTDPVPQQPPPTWCLELASWKKALMHSPVSIWTKPYRALTVLTSSIPFAFPSITHPLWYHPEWIAIILLIHIFRHWNGRSSCQTFDFISLCLRKWIILSLIMERNRISVTLKIERSRLWAFPFLHLTIQSEWVNVSAFSVCKKVISAGVWALQMRHTMARCPCLKHYSVRLVFSDARS